MHNPEHNRGVNPKSGRVIMNKSRSSSFRASAAVAIASIGGSLLAATAFATPTNPASLSPGQSSLSVPLYGSSASNYSTAPTGHGLQYCVNGLCATGTVSTSDIIPLLSGDGGFLEIAGTTNLNPFGADDVTFAVAFGGDAANGVLSAVIPGLSTWATDVQACDPSVSALLPCPPTGSGATAARDSAGDVTFSATATTGLPVNQLLLGQATDVYAIYTNAPMGSLTLIDPTAVITYANGDVADFAALSLMPPSSTGTVPEPSVLGLLAAGLATLALGMGLRRRSSR
ncbi:MAG TPA: PEP-CTERM sorting domain-containing protein [Steroidobacteraceae bacterium]|nr:PEP-CTERM sorting domain-containing protein [Steroidobacteraceae bacterium]